MKGIKKPSEKGENLDEKSGALGDSVKPGTGYAPGEVKVIQLAVCQGLARTLFVGLVTAYPPPVCTLMNKITCPAGPVIHTLMRECLCMPVLFPTQNKNTDTSVSHSGQCVTNAPEVPVFVFGRGKNYRDNACHMRQCVTNRPVLQYPLLSPRDPVFLFPSQNKYRHTDKDIN